MVLVIGPSWMDPIIAFLFDGVLPSEVNEAEKIQKISGRFWLSRDRRLDRRLFGGPYLLCLHPEKVDNLLAELHKGICGSHTGGRSLAHRVMTQGFWWPKMQRDAVKYVKRCDH